MRSFSYIPPRNNSGRILAKVFKNQTNIPALVRQTVDPKSSRAMPFLVRSNNIRIKENLFGLEWRDLVGFQVIGIVIIPDKKIPTLFAKVNHVPSVATM
ncbi:MAG: hypothetical protein NTY08_12565 [Proteobacteria bacterium]|nr:hypothetical protein [Pseudomonadota bacterium]